MTEDTACENISEKLIEQDDKSENTDNQSENVIEKDRSSSGNRNDTFISEKQNKLTDISDFSSSDNVLNTKETLTIKCTAETNLSEKSLLSEISDTKLQKSNKTSDFLMSNNSNFTNSLECSNTTKDSALLSKFLQNTDIKSQLVSDSSKFVNSNVLKDNPNYSSQNSEQIQNPLRIQKSSDNNSVISTSNSVTSSSTSLSDNTTISHSSNSSNNSNINMYQCVCQSPEEGNMICCDGCEIQYHMSCVDVDENESEQWEKYYCFRCLGLNDSKEGYGTLLQKSSIDRKLDREARYEKRIRQQQEAFSASNSSPVLSSEDESLASTIAKRILAEQTDEENRITYKNTNQHLHPLSQFQTQFYDNKFKYETLPNFTQNPLTTSAANHHQILSIQKQLFEQQQQLAFNTNPSNFTIPPTSNHNSIDLSSIKNLSPDELQKLFHAQKIQFEIYNNNELMQLKLAFDNAITSSLNDQPKIDQIKNSFNEKFHQISLRHQFQRERLEKWHFEVAQKIQNDIMRRSSNLDEKQNLNMNQAIDSTQNIKNENLSKRSRQNVSKIKRQKTNSSKTKSKNSNSEVLDFQIRDRSNVFGIKGKSTRSTNKTDTGRNSSNKLMNMSEEQNDFAGASESKQAQICAQHLLKSMQNLQHSASVSASATAFSNGSNANSNNLTQQQIASQQQKIFDQNTQFQNFVSLAQQQQQQSNINPNSNPNLNQLSSNTSSSNSESSNMNLASSSSEQILQQSVLPSETAAILIKSGIFDQTQINTLDFRGKLVFDSLNVVNICLNNIPTQINHIQSVSALKIDLEKCKQNLGEIMISWDMNYRACFSPNLQSIDITQLRLKCYQLLQLAIHHINLVYKIRQNLYNLWNALNFVLNEFSKVGSSLNQNPNVSTTETEAVSSSSSEPNLSLSSNSSSNLSSNSSCTSNLSSNSSKIESNSSQPVQSIVDSFLSKSLPSQIASSPSFSSSGSSLSEETLNMKKENESIVSTEVSETLSSLSK